MFDISNERGQLVSTNLYSVTQMQLWPPLLPSWHLPATRLDVGSAHLRPLVRIWEKDAAYLTGKAKGANYRCTTAYKPLCVSWFALCNRSRASVRVCSCNTPPPSSLPLAHAIYPFCTNWEIFFQKLLLHSFNYLFWREAIWWLVKRLCVRAWVCVDQRKGGCGRSKIRSAARFLLNVF